MLPEELRTVAELDASVGIRVRFTLDPIEYDTRINGIRTTMQCEGVWTGREIIIQANAVSDTAEQINAHELVHAKKNYAKKAYEKLQSTIVQVVPKGVMHSLMDQYIVTYEHVYNNVHAIDLMLEEIVADIAGKMSPLSNIPEIQEAVEEFNLGVYRKKSARSIWKGVGESRYSIEKNGENTEALRYAKQGADAGELESSKVQSVVSEAQIRARIAKMPKNIRMGQQKKHLEGTHEYKQYVQKFKDKGEYGPSRIIISEDDIRRLIRKHSGTGVIRIRNGKWQNYEIIVDCDEIVGIVVNNRTGKEMPTSIFKLHYSKDGIHMVPDYPSKRR